MLSAEEKRSGKKKKTVAAYIRVSTEKDDQENSFEVQKKYFDDLLLNSDRYINAGIYCDQGVSGTSLENRTALLNLLHDCKKGKVKRVICKSISRMTRNVQDFIYILKFLKEQGVTVLFEKEHIDTANLINEIAVTTLAAVSEKESRSIAENINWANEKRYSSGEVPNEVMYCYQWSDENTLMTSGYKYRNIEIDPAEAEIVKRIYEEAANGTRYCSIAKKLNSEQITPPTEFGKKRKKTKPCKKWNGRHIYRIISNERYTGCVMTQKTFTADPVTHKRKENKGEHDRHMILNHHPAIVSIELFKKAQTMRERNSEIYGNNKTGGRRTQTLSGLLICPVCGRKFHTNGRNRTPYWFCPEKCGKRIDETVVFDLIRKALYIHFGSDNDFVVNLKRLLAMPETYNERKVIITKEMAAMQARTETLNTQKDILAKKLDLISNAKAKKIFIKNIDLLNKLLGCEEERYDSLKSEYEDLVESEKNYLKNIDFNEKLLSVLEKEENKDRLAEQIIHKYIKAVILKITIMSCDNISVQWLDNSITVVRRSEYEG